MTFKNAIQNTPKHAIVRKKIKTFWKGAMVGVPSPHTLLPCILRPFNPLCFLTTRTLARLLKFKKRNRININCRW